MIFHNLKLGYGDDSRPTLRPVTLCDTVEVFTGTGLTE